MGKISIVMAYNNRKKLLRYTLNTIICSEVKDFEIIIVDDCSREEERIECLKEEFPTINFNIIRLEQKDKWYSNPCIPYNIGFRQIKGDLVIIQNPECCYNGDILKYVLENCSNNSYNVHACYSLNENDTYNILHKNEKVKIANRAATIDGDSAWYVNSRLFTRYLHFCSSITKKDLFELGGFDERYAKGFAYDDNEFVERIRRKGMKMNICDNPFVFHQFHYSSPRDFKNVTQNNEHIFRTITLRENIIRPQEL